MNKDYINAGRRNQKQKTRQRILSGAQDLLNSKGSFTLEDVAECSGMSRATVYRYFSSAEALSLEAALDLTTNSPEEVLESVKANHNSGVTLEIQQYFHDLAITNESVFRKYLSVVITQPPEGRVRGARRHQTLELALTKLNLGISAEERAKLIVVATVLMGIEPIIVTKDVCGLNDQDSLEALSWGLEMILKGIQK
ncbi:TetR/AcrR family transcriptional regulator [Aureitalea marina]|uniref:HTH tetR-type domain-containing protein n=1 Tax=Aureitalea marina TaxID=930804 RepID=A0A2S7KMH6_9FLAO|nr:TetR/AcrR family transcriptional regulator [Aureitalea marina]PQB03801.1 hypothetical protein BST85_01945 [Aureitalea marina]